MDQCRIRWIYGVLMQQAYFAAWGDATLGQPKAMQRSQKGQEIENGSEERSSIINTD